MNKIKIITNQEIIIIILIKMKTTPIVNIHKIKKGIIIIMKVHKMKIINTVMIKIINIQTKDNMTRVPRVNKMI